MDYIKTYEQISNGENAFIIMTSDKKYFVKYDAFLESCHHHDDYTSGFVLRDVSEIDASHFGMNEQQVDISLQSYKRGVDRFAGDKFAVTPFGVYYSAIRPTHWLGSNLDDIDNKQEGAEVILHCLKLDTREDKEVQPMFSDTKFDSDGNWDDDNPKMKLEFNSEAYDKIANDLIIVKFFVGFQEVGKKQEDDYLNI